MEGQCATVLADHSLIYIPAAAAVMIIIAGGGNMVCFADFNTKCVYSLMFLL